MLFHSLKDRDSATKCGYRFKQYLIDHVITSVTFFFFLSFCTSVYTFLSENTDDVFILNNLALVEPAIWKGDVSWGQGCLLVEGSHLLLRPQHTHQPPQIQFHGAWAAVWLVELILLSWYLTSSLCWKSISTAFSGLYRHDCWTKMSSPDLLWWTEFNSITVSQRGKKHTFNAITELDSF